MPGIQRWTICCQLNVLSQSLRCVVMLLSAKTSSKKLIIKSGVKQSGSHLRRDGEKVSTTGNVENEVLLRKRA